MRQTPVQECRLSLGEVLPGVQPEAQVTLWTSYMGDSVRGLFDFRADRPGHTVPASRRRRGDSGASCRRSDAVEPCRNKFFFYSNPVHLFRKNVKKNYERYKDILSSPRIDLCRESLRSGEWQGTFSHVPTRVGWSANGCTKVRCGRDRMQERCFKLLK